MTEHIFPVKVIKTEGNVKNAASLLKKKDLLAGFFEKNQAIVSGEAAIMLDFGKEYCGSVRIITTARAKINACASALASRFRKRCRPRLITATI